MEETVGRNPEEMDSSEILNKPEFQQFLEIQGTEREFLEESLRLLIEGDVIQEKRSAKADSSQMSIDHLLVRSRVTRKFKNDEERNAFLAKLYRLHTVYNIERLQQIFQEEHLSELLSMFQKLDAKFSQLGMFEIQHFIETSGEKLQEPIDQLNKLIEALQTNHEKPPFDEASKDDKWRELPEFSADLTNISNIIEIYSYLKKIQSLDSENEDPDPQDQIAKYPVYLQFQAKALQGCLRLLDNSKRELLSAQKTETISDWSFLDDLKHLLSAQQIQREHAVTPVPMKIEIIPEKDGTSPQLQNVDQNQLFRALLCMAEEAFEEEKVTPETLNSHLASNKPYLYLKVTKMQDHQGNDMIAILVADMGKPANFEEIEADTGRKIKNGSDLMDALSSKDYNKKLHAAREIVRDNHGDIMCSEVRDGGIGFLIALPMNGKKDPCNLQFVKGKLGSHYPRRILGIADGISSEVEKYISIEFSSDSSADAQPEESETLPRSPK